MNWPELDTLLACDPGLDSEAWNPVIQRLRPRLLGVLLARGVDRELAEDVVQDTLLLVWLRWKTLRQRDRAGAWIMSILLNRLRTHLARRREQSDVPEHVFQAQRGPLERLVRREGLAWLWRAVIALPRHERDPVTLRLVQGLSSESASRALGITRPNLRRRLHEGITRLRRRARSQSGRRAAHAMGLAPRDDSTKHRS